ncbi:MAG: hypothetical protein DMF65_06905 [Acidobacteria bacterium]|nr:MAG: hypothetical protein DMF65_06905 [Acidobacteriota bacterium]
MRGFQRVRVARRARLRRIGSITLNLKSYTARWKTYTPRVISVAHRTQEDERRACYNSRTV